MVTTVSFPIAGRDTAWDATAAEKRIREKTGSDDEPSAQYKKCFLWRDEDNDDNFGAYKLLVCDVIGGKIEIVPKAVFAVAGVLNGARGGASIPQADQEKIKQTVVGLYKKMAEKFDDDTIVAPFGVKKSYDEDFFGFYKDRDSLLSRNGLIIDGREFPVIGKSFTTTVINNAVDGNQNIVKLRVAVNKRDREGETIQPLGLDTSLWLKPNDKSPTGKSGIVCWFHDLSSPAIARALTWEATEQYADMVQEYHDFTELARNCRDMRKAGFLNESSVHATPLEWFDKQDASIHSNSGGAPIPESYGDWTRTYTKALMTEVSDCNAGVNPFTETLERAIRKAVASDVIKSDSEMCSWFSRVQKSFPITIISKDKEMDELQKAQKELEELKKAGATISAKNKGHFEKADGHIECADALHKAFGKAFGKLHDKVCAIHAAVASGEEPDEKHLKNDDVRDSMHKAIDKAFGKAEGKDNDTDDYEQEQLDDKIGTAAKAIIKSMQKQVAAQNHEEEVFSFIN